MKSKFLTDLDFHLKSGSDKIYILDSPLVYYSEILNRTITVPPVFYTDLASVPRLPIVFWFWGGKVHREGVLHDYLFRKDSDPVVSFWMANSIFKEAMIARGKPFCVTYPMFSGVTVGGYPSYHKKMVMDIL